MLHPPVRSTHPDHVATRGRLRKPHLNGIALATRDLVPNGASERIEHLKGTLPGPNVEQARCRVRVHRRCK